MPTGPSSSVLRATLRHLQEPPAQQPRARGPAAAAAAGNGMPATRFHGPESDPDPAAARTMGLSPAEIVFFKANGFIVKRKLIPAKDLSPFVEKFWDEAKPPSLDRHDPSTWLDPAEQGDWGPPPHFWAAEERVTGRTIRRQGPSGKLPAAEVVARELTAQEQVEANLGMTHQPLQQTGGAATDDSDRIKNHPHRHELGSIPNVNRPFPAGYRNGSIKWTELGGQPAFNDATSAHPNILRMVQTLIGGPIKRPHRNRGLYLNFPASPENEAADSFTSGGYVISQLSTSCTDCPCPL